MAFVDGEPLSDRLATSGRLSPAVTMSIVAQTADALDAAHAAGVVHRDIKPGNVLIDAQGRVILVDFGIAHTAATEGLTGVRDVLGTARYMAPEQATKRPLTPATDVYALGTLAYECLAGVPPFPGDDVLAVAMAHVHDEPPALPADVPIAVSDLVMTAMAKDPTRRFPTAASMATAARRAADPRTAANLAAAIVPSTATTAWVTATGLVPATWIARPEVTPVPPIRRSKRGVFGAVASLAIVGIAIAIVLAAFHPGISGTPPPKQPASTGAGRCRSGAGSFGIARQVRCERSNVAVASIAGLGAFQQAGSHNREYEDASTRSIDRSAEVRIADRWHWSVRRSEPVIGRRHHRRRGYVRRRFWRRLWWRRDSHAAAEHYRMISRTADIRGFEVLPHRYHGHADGTCHR